MPALTERRTSTFRADGRDLEHPVDSLGRVRYRAQLDTNTITRDADNPSGSIGFKGTAIVFNTRTWIGSRAWGFWEQIAPEAVTKTLREADVRFLQNHDPNLLLARNKANTLWLRTSDRGLEVEADMAPVSYAQDLAVLLERGDISQMSFAFDPLEWRYEEAEDGKELFTITELRLWDVSVVTYPAYTETDAGLRAAGFDALARSIGLPAEEFLRRVNDGDPEIASFVRDQLAATEESAPPESTRTETSEPAETTRSEDPPAESTGDPINPGDHLRDRKWEDHLRTIAKERT